VQKYSKNFFTPNIFHYNKLLYAKKTTKRLFHAAIYEQFVGYMNHIDRKREKVP